MPSGSTCTRLGQSVAGQIFWPLLLSVGFTRAQGPGLGLEAGVSLSLGLGSPSIPTCLNAVTVTVFPPDYTGIYASLTTPGISWTTIPPLTISTPGEGSITSGLSLTASSGASISLPGLPLTSTTNEAASSSLLPEVDGAVPTTLPGELSSLLSAIGSSLSTNLPGDVTSRISNIGGALPTTISDASLPGLPLTTAPPLIPSLVQDVVSAIVPTSQLPTQTPVSFSCPENNGQVIIDNGLPYILTCNGASTGNVFGTELAAESFNDCFAECDQASVTGLANFCTGFYYVGTPDGDGPGTCYLQNSVAQTFRSARGYVSAARLLNYIVGGLEPIPLLDDTSSILVSIPSGLTVPTGLPTIAIPSLSLSLPSLPASLPLTTALPISDLTSLVPGLTSLLPPIIATPTTSDCGLLGLNCVGAPGSPTINPLTNLVPGLTSLIGEVLPTELPVTSVLAPLPSALSSVLAGLECDVAALLSAVGLEGGSPVVSSILAGPTQSICPLLSGLPSAALPTLSIPLSSGPAFTTALDPISDSLSSILAGLPCNVNGLLTNLGLSSSDAVISSILAGPTGNICSLLSAFPTAYPSSIPSLEQSTNLPLTTALVPIPSALSSIIAGLPCDVASLHAGLSGSNPIASSILAGPPSDICSLLSSLSSGLPSVTPPTLSVSLPSGFPLTTELALPSDLPVSSLPSDLSNPAVTLPSVALPTITGSALPSALSSIPSSLSLPTDVSLSISSLALPTPPSSLTLSGLPIPSGSLSLSLSVDFSISVPSLALPTVSSLSSRSDVQLPSIFSTLSSPSIALPTVSASLPSLSLPSSLSAPTVPLPTISASITSLSLPLSASSISVALPSVSQLITGGGGNPLTDLPLSSSPAASRPTTSTTVSSLVLPTSTNFPVISCPSDQGLTYVSSSGQAFNIQCNRNYPLSTSLGTSTQPNLYSCANSCGTVPGCAGVTFDSSTSTCFYKPNTLGQPTDAGLQEPTFSAAIPVNLDCPNGDGAYYTDYLGASYQIMCNVTFPSSANITTGLDIDANAGVSLEVRDEAAHHLETRQFAVPTPQIPPIIVCSNRCSRMPGCIAVTEQTDQCVFISDLGVSATGSSIADTVVLVGRRIVDPSTGARSMSLVSNANPTRVSSRPASGIGNTPLNTATSTIGLLPSISIPPIIASPTTTSDCGLLGLNCVSGQQPAATPTTSDCGLLGLNCVGGNAGSSRPASPATSGSATSPAVLPGAPSPLPNSGTAQTTATSSDCGLLGLNCVGGNAGSPIPTPVSASGGSTVPLGATSTTTSSSTSTDCGLLGLNCIGGNAGGASPTSVSSVGAITTSSLLTSSPLTSSSTGTIQTVVVSPVPASSSTRDCGLLGLGCVIGGGGSNTASSSMSTITTRTTSYSQITAIIPVTTITTTSTVSYCNVGPNNFTSCTSSVVVSAATRPSSSSSSSSSPTTTTRNCGLLGLNCT
ncbi:hypothetical protein Slin15195_G047580 [Septoria linicola]|uniref:Apple domain-containing protein n=1 Tax=Septoria linicola TaxID=215465 RepID=A0A9Q9ALD1_9PEZI|nr:hypothetical protein Slin14017_G051110 [Septoria linicola]USW51439.1 hypothetical protein Slin15195_G047580 [Septoria linicola]